MQRRKYRRINVELRLEYAVEGGPSKKAKLATYTKNVGAKGMCFSVKEDLSLNAVLSLKIYVPDKKDPIEAKGSVVWKGKFTSLDNTVRYDIGVDINQISESDQKRLRQHLFDLIDKRAPK
jgi:c-di-GMP-binding flagellar brake protein YcgR